MIKMKEFLKTKLLFAIILMMFSNDVFSQEKIDIPKWSGLIINDLTMDVIVPANAPCTPDSPQIPDCDDRPCYPADKHPDCPSPCFPLNANPSKYSACASSEYPCKQCWNDDKLCGLTNDYTFRLFSKRCDSGYCNCRWEKDQPDKWKWKGQSCNDFNDPDCVCKQSTQYDGYKRDPKTGNYLRDSKGNLIYDYFGPNHSRCKRPCYPLDKKLSECERPCSGLDKPLLDSLAPCNRPCYPLNNKIYPNGKAPTRNCDSGYCNCRWEKDQPDRWGWWRKGQPCNDFSNPDCVCKQSTQYDGYKRDPKTGNYLKDSKGNLIYDYFGPNHSQCERPCIGIEKPEIPNCNRPCADLDAKQCRGVDNKKLCHPLDKYPTCKKRPCYPADPKLPKCTYKTVKMPVIETTGRTSYVSKDSPGTGTTSLTADVCVKWKINNALINEMASKGLPITKDTPNIVGCAEVKQQVYNGSPYGIHRCRTGGREYNDKDPARVICGNHSKEYVELNVRLKSSGSFRCYTTNAGHTANTMYEVSSEAGSIVWRYDITGCDWVGTTINGTQGKINGASLGDKGRQGVLYYTPSLVRDVIPLGKYIITCESGWIVTQTDHPSDGSLGARMLYEYYVNSECDWTSDLVKINGYYLSAPQRDNKWGLLVPVSNINNYDPNLLYE